MKKAGWDTVAEYTDNDTDWAVEGFSKFNVMTDFMHPLAEATVASGQPPANAAYSYLALDHLSSTRGVFSQTKTQTGTMEFLPYGARHTATGTLPHHQFTAKPYDTGTGLYTFPYRHYSPTMARWTGPDPAGLADGPNVYGYVKARPNAEIDTLGLEVCDTDKDCCDQPGRYLACCDKNGLFIVGAKLESTGLAAELGATTAANQIGCIVKSAVPRTTLQQPMD